MPQGAVYEWPDHAERFRWRILNEVNCLEVLRRMMKSLATVYRDSAALMGDAYGVDGPVVLAEHQAGLATLSTTHVSLMEPWDSMLVHWKGEDPWNTCAQQPPQSASLATKYWISEATPNGTTRPS